MEARCQPTTAQLNDSSVEATAPEYQALRQNRHRHLSRSDFIDSPRIATACAIELKGFNPPRHLVLEDLRRNLDFHRLNGTTGPSVLDLSFFGALHSRSAKRATNNEQSVKERYRKWITELGTISNLVTHILTFTVSIDATGQVVEEVDEWVLDTTTIHHFIGAIVVFERSNSLVGIAWPDGGGFQAS